MASSKSSNRGPGFAFGVALGAVLGTGALILMGEHHDSRQIKKSLQQKLQGHLKTLKEKYPEEAKQVEDLLTSSFEELKQANLEIKQKAEQATTQAKEVADTLKQHSPEKRTFTRSGRKLNPEA